MGYRMVTWPMTSRDLERSNSWPQYAWSAISRKLLELETSNLVGGFVLGMPSRRTNNLPESGRGLGRVTPTIFGSTVGYPSDSLTSCYVLLLEDTWPKCLVCIRGKTAWIQHTCEQVGTHSTVVNNVNNRISVIKETNQVYTCGMFSACLLCICSWTRICI